MANRELAQTDIEAIEARVDFYDFTAVVEALVTIAHEKAEHVRSAWQDEALAKSWERKARVLDKAVAMLREQR
jgi:hypothetical protein